MDLVTFTEEILKPSFFVQCTETIKAKRKQQMLPLLKSSEVKVLFLPNQSFYFQ